MNIRRWIVLASALISAAYLATGWTNVAPGEEGVVRRLGRVITPVWGPGPHLGWPYGLDRIHRVRLDEVRRLDVGLSETSNADSEPGAGEFLTGDLNLLRAKATLQYRVADPVAYLSHTKDVEPLLKRLAEASLARALAGSGIDASLGEGRSSVAIVASRDLEATARRYGLGISVLSISLTDARPPVEVAPAFAAAQSARSEHDRRVNEAKSYAATTVTKAEAAAGAKLETAHARSERVIAIARSKAARFLSLLAEVEKSRGMTIRRLYLDALKEMLPRVRRKLVLTPEEPVDLSILGDR